MDDSRTIKALEESGCDVKGALEATFMGREDFYCRMARRMASEDRLSSLRDAVAGGDAGAVFEAAHELKGLYANLGLTPLHAIASAITEVARAGSVGGTDVLFGQLEKIHDGITRSINEGF